MLNDLKECPFCGGRAEHFRHHDYGGWSNTDSISCLDCGCGTCLHESKEMAVGAWNRRAALKMEGRDE